MYMIGSMLGLGLKDGQTFPTDAYRVVAGNIGLANPNVTTKDTLTEVVQAVLAVPADRIKAITPHELRTEFNKDSIFDRVIPREPLYTIGVCLKSSGQLMTMRANVGESDVDKTVDALFENHEPEFRPLTRVHKIAQDGDTDIDGEAAEALVEAAEAGVLDVDA